MSVEIRLRDFRRTPRAAAHTPGSRIWLNNGIRQRKGHSAVGNPPETPEARAEEAVQAALDALSQGLSDNDTRLPLCIYEVCAPPETPEAPQAEEAVETAVDELALASRKRFLPPEEEEAEAAEATAAPHPARLIRELIRCGRTLSPLIRLALSF